LEVFVDIIGEKEGRYDCKKEYISTFKKPLIQYRKTDFAWVFDDFINLNAFRKQ
jgi:hypothetical protein